MSLYSLDFIFTFKILILLIVAFLVITSWDEFLDRTMFKYLNLDPESISGWFVIAVISTLVLFLILIFMKIEVHEAFGISETVDRLLTGTTESFVNGEIVHAEA